MNLYSLIVGRGIPHDHHESDLYVPVTQQTAALLRTYPHRTNVTVFTSQIDGKPWFDVPFAYQPFWDKKSA